MDPILSRIDAWQQIGLIDLATADRLRADQAAQPSSAGSSLGGGVPSASLAAGLQGPVRQGISAADVLGPGPTVVEMFCYLGGAFLLGAWSTFVTRLSGEQGNAAVVGGGFLVAAVVMAAIGLALRTGDDRRRRGAGVVFVAAIGYAVGSAAGFLGGLGVSGSAETVILAVVALAVATVVRQLHAALLTQLGLLAAITAAAAALLRLLRDVVAPADSSEGGQPVGAVVDPLLMIAVTAAVWLVVAVIIGFLGLRESTVRRASGDAPGGGDRRATLTRAWAGVVAVAGLASALSVSDIRPEGNFDRVITPWIMDAILLGLTAILVERAFRRRSSAFLLAAGIGLIVALTDLNFSYLSGSPEFGLLIEGGLLLAVGFGADRLRRRLPDRRVDRHEDERTVEASSLVEPTTT